MFNFTCLQVKPNAEYQKDDGKNFKAGVDQLDTLGFLELTPDIKMDKVGIATNLAVHLVTKSSDRALTNNDFLTEFPNFCWRYWEFPRTSCRFRQDQMSNQQMKIRKPWQELYVALCGLTPEFQHKWLWTRGWRLWTWLSLAQALVLKPKHQIQLNGKRTKSKTWKWQWLEMRKRIR